MRRAVVLLIALVVAPALAGCAASEEPVSLEALSLGAIEGTVTDASLKPLHGATVRVEGQNLSTTTDETGAFALRIAPGDHLVLAAMEGFRGGALRAAPGAGESARLAFALTPIPSERPEVVVAEQHGLISCGATVIVAGDAQPLACGGNDPNQRVRVPFAVTQTHGLLGAVVEVAWTPNAQATAWLDVTVSAGEGESATFLAQTAAADRIVISIPDRVLAPAIGSGATLIVDVRPAGSLTDDEAGVDAGAAFQQPFTVYLSLFYHEAQAAGYTVARADG